MRPALVLSLAVVAFAAPADAATLVGPGGIGPLKLGMSRSAALATGWLSNRHPGCELGGPPLPVDYDVDGAKAPAAITGTAEFVGGRLTNLAFRKGVRTATGVVPGTTSWPSMVTRYREAGYKVSARYEPTFGGTFVSVKRRHGGQQVLGGFAQRGQAVSALGVPYVPVCE
jgi:hypothetical protein